MRLNVSIDDISPHPKIGMDALNRLREIVESHNIKVSLFVPTCVKRFGDNEKKYYLLEDYPKFVDELKSLPQNFEICHHGHKHGKKDPKSNNDEFRYLSQQETVDILNRSREVFNNVGLTVRPVLRPPGFWISKDAFKGCVEFGIKVLALNDSKRYMRSYGKAARRYKHVVFPGIQPKKKDAEEIFYHAGDDQPDYFSKKFARRVVRRLNKAP